MDVSGSMSVSTSAAKTLLLQFANGIASNFGFSVDSSGDGVFQGTLSVEGTALNLGNGTTADINLNPPIGKPRVSGQYADRSDPRGC